MHQIEIIANIGHTDYLFRKTGFVVSFIFGFAIIYYMMSSDRSCVDMLLNSKAILAKWPITGSIISTA